MIKSIKIGPLKFAVSVEDFSDTAIGDVSYPKCKIRIADICKQVQQETLLHECLHMLLFISGNTEHADDEGLVSSLSPMLLSFLRENTNLISYLLEGCRIEGGGSGALAGEWVDGKWVCYELE